MALEDDIEKWTDENFGDLVPGTAKLPPKHLEHTQILAKKLMQLPKYVLATMVASQLLGALGKASGPVVNRILEVVGGLHDDESSPPE